MTEALDLQPPPDDGESAYASSKRVTVLRPNEAEAPPQAMQLFQQASQAYTKSNFANASRLVNQALALDANFGDALFLRGMIALKDNQTATAEADIQSAVDNDGGIEPAWIYLAKFAEDNHQLPLARQDLQHALGLPDVMWQADYDLAALDLHSGAYADVAPLAVAALQAKPHGPPECIYLEARADDRAGNSAAAIAEYKRYLSSHPGVKAKITAAQERLQALEAAKPQPSA